MKGRLRLSYVRTLCLVFTLAVTMPLIASAEVIEEWVAQYNGPADGTDYASAIAMDSLGNIYVTGTSEEDYATVKYDINGNELWVARYNGLENGWDRPEAIAVDDSGNVYVTGWSGYRDYATVKYDTHGNQLWVARYNGPGDWNEAKAIAVDASGNVYVTGDSRGSGTGYDIDYATVKYDTNGNQLWVARYNGPENEFHGACAIAVDSSGNVYVTGESATVKYDTGGNQLWVAQHPANAIAVDASGNVYVTEQRNSWPLFCDAAVKYDADGNQLWVSCWGESLPDEAKAIVVDAWGNVYVTGGSLDYVTVKYDINGNKQWVAQYNGPGNVADSARAIAIDSSGNVYVTGESPGSGTGDDYATVKYDTNGNQLWVQRYNGPANSEDKAHAIAMDAAGNVYVTGESLGSGTNDDYATVKYDTNGNQLWVARYNSLGIGYDAASAIAVDVSGNVYVTGESKGIGTENDYATVKYDTNGNQLWVARYDGPGNSYDWAHDMAVDASGNVYVTGMSMGTGMEFDYATVKYDTNGNQLWVARYDGPENEDDWAMAMAVDASGNVYVTGSSFSETDDDYATVKYDTNGNQLWVARYDGPGNESDSAGAIAVDAAGNVYVTGQSLSETDDDYATVKYDTNGHQLWVARYDGPGNESDTATAIAVDAAGNVYVTGGSKGSGTDWDYATVKYDTNGNEQWVARYNGPGNEDDWTRSIALDSSGNIYVTGQSKGSGINDDYATVKYDSNGNLLWVKRYDGPGNEDDLAWAMAVDASGNVYVTGQSKGSGTGDDYATVKYDSNGNQLWVQRYNGPGSDADWAWAMAVETSGNVYVTGESHSGIGYDYATVKYSEGLPAGWSMMSLPVRPEVPTVANVFPQAVVVYKYQKGAGYVRVEPGQNLEVGIGYWILLDSPQPYVMEGTDITDYTLPVADGWYMIGGCSMPADKMVTSGKIDVIYEYTQGSGYTRVPVSQPLERGKGYWILFSDTTEGAEFTASTSASE